MWPIPEGARNAIQAQALDAATRNYAPAPPETASVERLRGEAKNPYLKTKEEVDFETAVARSLAGQDVGRPLARLEQVAVAKHLHAKNFTDRAIALHLDVHEGTVHRLIHGRPARKGGHQ
jgi:hypothetical protein